MERYSLDVVSKTLIITEKFSKKLQDPDSDEFTLYTKLMETIPGLTVANRTHKSPSRCVSKSTGEMFNCNQFKNLKYENMERFMSGLPNCEEYFAEYNFLRESATSIQTNGYALVRRWFVKQFPHFRKNPLFYVYNTPALVSASEVIAEAETEELKEAS